MPFGDMFNHRYPENVKWEYNNKLHGFVLDAKTDINKDEQIFDTYGSKSNYVFFHYYGMV